MVDLALANGIKVVSFWGLAKKNILERSEEELGYLYNLFGEFIQKIRGNCQKNEIRFEFVGDITLLPDFLQKQLQDVQLETAEFSKMTVILAIGYGGQDEIVRAARKAIESGISPNELNETSFLKFLDTGAFPPPDLIIRTGGDVRHSGYFLYQAEYSEYYFTNTLWPDFNEEEFYKALKSLKNATRNFGK